MQNAAFHGVNANTTDRFSLAIREKIRENSWVVPHGRRKSPITGDIFRNGPKISFFPALREIPPFLAVLPWPASFRTGGECQQPLSNSYCIQYTQRACPRAPHSNVSSLKKGKRKEPPPPPAKAPLHKVFQLITSCSVRPWLACAQTPFPAAPV